LAGRAAGGAPPGQPAAASSRRLPGLHPVLLAVLYAFVGLLPVALAVAQGLPARNAWRELSGGLVLIGFSLLLVQFVLSGRFRQVTGRVGIDVTMRFHQLAARVVLALILVHPLLYAAPRLWPEPVQALVALQRMFASPGLRTGVIAWWLLLLLVPLAVFRDPLPVRYEVWRLSHGLGAAAIALSGLHHTLRVGTHSGDPWLAGFWLLMAGLALLALVQVYLIKPLLQLQAPYRVVANRPAAERIWEVTIEPTTGPAIDFAPGQFVWLNLGHSPFSLAEHPFSISSAPAARPRLAFTIKESGDFTAGIGRIAPGTVAYVDGPHGNFTLAGRRVRSLVLIAGGVGFAPIMSILRQLAADRHPHPVHLIYGNRVPTQILHRDETLALRSVLRLRVSYVLAEPPPGWTGITGEPTPEVLRRLLDPLDRDAHHFVCGPAVMMDGVEGTLAQLGVPPARIVTERFRFN
jgi:predicted ferric reductase